MEKEIKITKDLKFEYQDLMRVVDLSQEFTLRDVLNVCLNSKIPFDVLSCILRCSYLVDYIEEMNAKTSKNNGGIDYLEIYWWGTKQTCKGKREDGSMWSFHGVGKLGVVPKDILKYGNLTDEDKANYRQAMAVEFSPIYKLADLPIKVSKKLHITDYNANPKEDMDSDIDIQPSITLIELLHAIFWELSYCGSPIQRDEKMDGLKLQIDEFKKASKKGKLVSHEQVKKQLEKNIKTIEKRG